jgi:hypothetical protein
MVHRADGGWRSLHCTRLKSLSEGGRTTGGVPGEILQIASEVGAPIDVRGLAQKNQTAYAVPPGLGSHCRTEEGATVSDFRFYQPAQLTDPRKVPLVGPVRTTEGDSIGAGWDVANESPRLQRTGRGKFQTLQRACQRERTGGQSERLIRTRSMAIDEFDDRGRIVQAMHMPDPRLDDHFHFPSK